MAPLLGPSGIKDCRILQAEFELPNSQIFGYLRLRHALSVQLNDEIGLYLFFPLPTYLLSPPSSHAISYFYSLLSGKSRENIMSLAWVHWKRDLDLLTEVEWGRAKISFHKLQWTLDSVNNPESSVPHYPGTTQISTGLSGSVPKMWKGTWHLYTFDLEMPPNMGIWGDGYAVFKWLHGVACPPRS